MTEDIDDYYFRRDQDILVTFRDNLPHMHQDGKFQFVTFRLHDSLPQSKIIELQEAKDIFEKRYPKPWDAETRIKLRNIIGPMESRLLDNGYGECILRRPDVRKIVEDAIQFFDGEKYELEAYVIMPNHVHLLVRMIGTHQISDVIYSIKKFSAVKVNKLLNRTGAFWMKRYFDRMPRNEEEMTHYKKYIASNPSHLPAGTYSLFIKQ